MGVDLSVILTLAVLKKLCGGRHFKESLILSYFPHPVFSRSLTSGITICLFTDWGIRLHLPIGIFGLKGKNHIYQFIKAVNVIRYLNHVLMLSWCDAVDLPTCGLS